MLKELKLQYIDKQVQKILQFYEATHKRMGVIIVGQSVSDKKNMESAQIVFKKINQNILNHVMKLMLIPRNHMPGLINDDTKEIQDGMLTASARLVFKEPLETKCWIVKEGDIDPEGGVAELCAARKQPADSAERR